MKKKIIRLALITACILLIPVFGNLYVNGWNWDPFDFVFMGTLIFGSGCAYLWIASKGNTITYRAAIGVALAATFLLIWINGAVGIIGNEDNPANLLYFGVLVVGFIGVVMANFQPRRMARALFATAFTQALVPAIAFIIWRPDFSLGVVQVFALNAFFIMLFVVSALLFQRAAGIDKK